VPKNRRGFIMGLDGAINTVARVISGPLLGHLYKVFGPSVCFGTASAATGLAAIVTMLRRLMVLRW